MRFIRLIGLASLTTSFGLATAQEISVPEELPFNVEDMEKFNEEDAEKVIGSLNPLENDLRGLEVAMRLHRGFLIKPEGAIFNLGVTDGAGETRLDEAFVLIETSGVEAPTLTAEQREGFEFWTYRLDPKDYARMQAGDALLQELKRVAPGQNQLTFNAQAYTCANPDPLHRNIVEPVVVRVVGLRCVVRYQKLINIKNGSINLKRLEIFNCCGRLVIIA